MRDARDDFEAYWAEAEARSVAAGGYDRTRGHHDFDSAEERRDYYRRHAPAIVASAAAASNVLASLLRPGDGEPDGACRLAEELNVAMEKLLIAFC